eukprot:g2483.t1
MIRLNNGIMMPVTGIGTSHNEGGTSKEALMYALKQGGVRLIDTAKRYGSEALVGEVVETFEKESSDDRIFVTSKLWPGDVCGAGAGAVTKAFEETLSRLSFFERKRSLDMYLIHWPGLVGACSREEGGGADRRSGGDDRRSGGADRRSGGGLDDPNESRLRVWREMEAIATSSKRWVKSIGVSNFLERHLEPLLRSATIVPAVNQIEFNPFQHPKRLRAYCLRKKIVVQGYAPFGKGVCLRSHVVRRVARTMRCSESQALIRWSVLEQNVPCVWKSRKSTHIKDNAAALGTAETKIRFECDRRREGDSDDSDGLRKLNDLHEDMRVTWDPTRVP